MHIYREGLFHYKAYVADMQAGFTKPVRPTDLRTDTSNKSLRSIYVCCDGNF